MFSEYGKNKKRYPKVVQIVKYIFSESTTFGFKARNTNYYANEPVK